MEGHGKSHDLIKRLGSSSTNYEEDLYITSWWFFTIIIICLLFLSNKFKILKLERLSWMQNSRNRWIYTQGKQNLILLTYPSISTLCSLSIDWQSPASPQVTTHCTQIQHNRYNAWQCIYVFLQTVCCWFNMLLMQIWF